MSSVTKTVELLSCVPKSASRLDNFHKIGQAVTWCLEPAKEFVCLQQMCLLKIVPRNGQVPAGRVCEQILPAGANFSETSWQGSTLVMDVNARFDICRFVAWGRGG